MAAPDIMLDNNTNTVTMAPRRELETAMFSLGNILLAIALIVVVRMTRKHLSEVAPPLHLLHLFHLLHLLHLLHPLHQR